jgi:hypothetical protein
MYIENEIVLKGAWADVWRYSSEIEHWGKRLPHYIRVDILENLTADGRKRKAFMKAWRDILPVSWTTVQTLEPNADPAKAKVLYKHIGGVTKGMEVIWSFERLGDDYYRVNISHDWTPRWPLIGGPAAYIIQTQIVHHIADKTLHSVKKLAAQAQTNSTLSKAAL